VSLSGADGIAVVGTAGDGDEVRTADGTTAPDVVLMDIKMPRVDGITATEWLRRAASRSCRRTSRAVSSTARPIAPARRSAPEPRSPR
jgi:DNA-binding NarL/FixJ family response regulator